MTAVSIQAPGRPFTPTADSERDLPRIVLVRNGATVSSEDGIMMGSGNDPLTTLGEIQAQKTGEVLMDLKVALSLNDACPWGKPWLANVIVQLLNLGCPRR